MLVIGPGAGVSDREAEVLALLGEHLSHAEIAARLFISIRTVESHVASLRRKLQVPDRRALIHLAVDYRATHARPRLPTPPSSFIGREMELAGLADALGQARLVSAVGPGGVGKTRLALAVAERVADRFPGGTFYLDLVPVTDPAMVAAGVAAVVGTGEAAARSAEDALTASLRDRRALLVLDNCEHLTNAVAVLVEQLLSACVSLTVLVTSRIRLVVPFEQVYSLSGLSPTDAVALFRERASAAGATDSDTEGIAGICAVLDGMALAIELAAARLPALGPDGLAAALLDPLRLLSGGSRLAPRHASIRDTLDWSYQLLDPTDQAVLRQVSVFAAPFTADAAAQVAGAAPASLARLCEHSLLTRIGSRYRALEPVRQFGAAELDAAEDAQTRRRHLEWCLATVAELDREPTGVNWPADVDAATDDLRSALIWASGAADLRESSYRLATTLAHVLFVRGRPREAQLRYEQAAQLTDRPAESLENAAAVARCRTLGEQALRLECSAADAHIRAGDPVAAAITFARSAALVVRFVGMFAEPQPDGTVDELLAAARACGGTDLAATAAIAAAEAHATNAHDPRAVERAERALALARDPLLVTGLLDLRMSLHITHDEIAEAAAVAARRVELLADQQRDPAAALELKDTFHSAVMTAVGAGDLRTAVRLGDQHIDVPFHREERDLAVEDALAPHALAGNFDRVIALGAEFRAGWARAGRHAAPGRAMAPAAVAMVHGIRGDDAERAEWLAILAAVRGVPTSRATDGSGYGEVFDAIVLLHHGRPQDAFAVLDGADAHANRFYGQLFRHWRETLRAEAAVLAGRRDAADQLDVDVAGNPMALALLRRAAALRTGDRTAVLAVADAFYHAGSDYQAARTLVLAGQEKAEREARLAAMRLVPPRA